MGANSALEDAWPTVTIHAASEAPSLNLLIPEK